MAEIVLVKGRRKRRLVMQDNRFCLKKPRLAQKHGLPSAAEFVYGRPQDHPGGDSRHEH